MVLASSDSGIFRTFVSGSVNCDPFSVRIRTQSSAADDTAARLQVLAQNAIDSPVIASASAKARTTDFSTRGTLAVTV
jgi:hypothetical protein